MKLFWKGLGAFLAVGTVAGGVTAFVIVNKKDEIDAPAPNEDMYPVSGFEKLKMFSLQELKSEATKVGVTDKKFNYKSFFGKTYKLNKFKEFIVFRLTTEQKNKEAFKVINESQYNAFIEHLIIALNNTTTNSWDDVVKNFHFKARKDELKGKEKEAIELIRTK